MVLPSDDLVLLLALVLVLLAGLQLGEAERKRLPVHEKRISSRISATFHIEPPKRPPQQISGTHRRSPALHLSEREFADLWPLLAQDAYPAYHYPTLYYASGPSRTSSRFSELLSSLEPRSSLHVMAPPSHSRFPTGSRRRSELLPPPLDREFAGFDGPFTRFGSSTNDWWDRLYPSRLLSALRREWPPLWSDNSLF